jgi:hypothetical protein
LRPKHKAVVYNHEKELPIVFHSRVAAIADGLRESVPFSLQSPVVGVAWPSVAGQADVRRDPAVQGAMVRGGCARARPWRGET